MTELSIRPDEIRDALQRFVSDYKPETASREEVGTVSEAGDGIARVTGLPSVMANELLEFEDGTLGIALNLDTREIGVVILGDFDGIEEGQTVRRTGEILSVPGRRSACRTRWRGSTTDRCTSTSSSTPTWSAASASPSVTTSSTARSPAAWTTPAEGWPASPPG